MIKITTDSGHGGKDSGATKGTRLEKVEVLKFTKALNKRLEDHGFDVNTTRTGDYFIELGERSRDSNNFGSKIFISNHLNSFTEGAKGFEIYHYPNSVEGKKLAEAIHKEIIKENLYTVDRGVKSANFSVLRRTTAPAVLGEYVFISNKEDMKLWDSRFDDFVEATVKGICNYLGVEYKPVDDLDFIEDKINLLLMGNHLVLDGFLKNGTNYIKIDSKYISIRSLLESMGLLVTYSQHTGFIVADLRKMKDPEESFKASFIGNEINLSGITKEGTSYLKVEGMLIPIREVGKALGLRIGWNNSTKTVVIDI